MKIYEKNGQTAYVGHGTAVLSYGKVINPTEEMLINDGWTFKGTGYDEKDYSAMVEKIIRQRYSVSDELAILRQRDEKPEDYAAYYAYCEEAKKEAKRRLGITGEEE